MRCPLCQDASPRLFLSAEEDRLDHKAYSECPACKLVFLHPEYHLGPLEEKKRYDLHRNHPEDEGYVRFLSRLTEPLLKRLKPGAEGLDYGCGPGPTLSVILARAGYSVADYDPFYFPAADALTRQYDFITCTEAAEHFYHPGAEFERLAGLLKPGGCLAVMTDFLTMPERFVQWHYRRDPVHVSFYRAETFLYLADKYAWKADFPAANLVFFLSR